LEEVNAMLKAKLEASESEVAVSRKWEHLTSDHTLLEGHSECPSEVGVEKSGKEG
jgi:hypothetical protein